jgi:hypothetical protein
MANEKSNTITIGNFATEPAAQSEEFLWKRQYAENVTIEIIPKKFQGDEFWDLNITLNGETNSSEKPEDTEAETKDEVPPESDTGNGSSASTGEETSFNHSDTLTTNTALATIVTPKSPSAEEPTKPTSTETAPLAQPRRTELDDPLLVTAHPPVKPSAVWACL